MQFLQKYATETPAKNGGTYNQQTLSSKYWNPNIRPLQTYYYMAKDFWA